MSVLEFIAFKGLVDRATINRKFSNRSAEMVEREISFLVINGLIERCQTCETLKYQITKKGKESLPK